MDEVHLFKSLKGSKILDVGDGSSVVPPEMGQEVIQAVMRVIGSIDPTGIWKAEVHESASGGTKAKTTIEIIYDADPKLLETRIRALEEYSAQMKVEIGAAEDLLNLLKSIKMNIKTSVETPGSDPPAG